VAGGASFTGGVFVTGLLSPPLRPTTGAPLALGRRRNPILSVGTGADFGPPSISQMMLGEMRNWTNRAATTTWSPIDANK